MDSTTSADTRGITKREGGFKNKKHNELTKRRISQTQKKRYALLNQMVRQHQQNEQSQTFGPIDFDSPKLRQQIKDIVNELLRDEIKKATPIKPNIPVFL